MVGSNYGNMGDRASPEEEVIARYFLENAPGVVVDLNSPLFGDGIPVLYSEWMKDEAGGCHMGAFLFGREKLSSCLGEDRSLPQDVCRRIRRNVLSLRTTSPGCRISTEASGRMKPFP